MAPRICRWAMPPGLIATCLPVRCPRLKSSRVPSLPRSADQGHSPLKNVHRRGTYSMLVLASGTADARRLHCTSQSILLIPCATRTEYFVLRSVITWLAWCYSVLRTSSSVDFPSPQRLTASYNSRRRLHTSSYSIRCSSPPPACRSKRSVRGRPEQPGAQTPAHTVLIPRHGRLSHSTTRVSHLQPPLTLSTNRAMLPPLISASCISSLVLG